MIEQLLCAAVLQQLPVQIAIALIFVPVTIAVQQLASYRGGATVCRARWFVVEAKMFVGFDNAANIGAALDGSCICSCTSRAVPMLLSSLLFPSPPPHPTPSHPSSLLFTAMCVIIGVVPCEIPIQCDVLSAAILAGALLHLLVWAVRSVDVHQWHTTTTAHSPSTQVGQHHTCMSPTMRRSRGSCVQAYGAQ